MLKLDYKVFPNSLALPSQPLCRGELFLGCAYCLAATATAARHLDRLVFLLALSAMGTPRVQAHRAINVAIFKHLFALKPLGQSKPIFCGASMGKANNNLLAASLSHEQDGRHPHIW